MNFSKPDLNDDYQSSYDHTKNALSFPLILTDLFLNSTLQKDLLPSKIIDLFDLDDPDLFLRALRKQWQEVITHNWRFLTALVFGAVMALALPIIGIAWCCFSRRRKEDKVIRFSTKWDSKWRLGGLFLSLMMFSWACLAWHVGGNFEASVGAHGVGEGVGRMFRDAEMYMGNMVLQAEHLSNENRAEISGDVLRELDKGMVTLKSILDNVNNGTDINLVELTDNVGFLAETAEYFEANRSAIQAAVDEMQEAAADLTISVDEIATSESFDEILRHPEITNITFFLLLQALRESIKINGTSIPNSTLPVLEGSTTTAMALDHFQTDLIMGRSLLKTFPDKFGEFSLDIQATLSNLSAYINDQVHDILLKLEHLKFKDAAEDIADEIENFVNSWGDLFFIALLFPFATLMVVFLLYLSGCLLGSFGKEDGSFKRRGSRCLNAGTAVFFGFSIILWLSCLGMFFVGAMTQQLGCKTLEEPREAELYRMLEVDLNERLLEALGNEFDGVDFKLPDMLDLCQMNSSIYEVMHFNVIFDVRELEDWKTDYEIDVLVDIVTSQLTGDMNQILVRLQIPEETESLLNVFASKLDELQAELLDKFARFDPAQTFNQTAFNQLNIGVRHLSQYVDQISQQHNDSTLLEDMDVVNDMMARAVPRASAFDEATTLAVNLVNDYDIALTFGDLTAGDNARSALSMSAAAVEYLSGNGNPPMLTNLNATLSSVVGSVQSFISHVINFFESDFGGCKPAYDGYFGVVKAACWSTVDPFNAMWSGLGLTLLLLVPTVVVACALSDVYERNDLNLGERRRGTKELQRAMQENKGQVGDPFPFAENRIAEEKLPRAFQVIKLESEDSDIYYVITDGDKEINVKLGSRKKSTDV